MYLLIQQGVGQNHIDSYPLKSYSCSVATEPDYKLTTDRLLARYWLADHGARNFDGLIPKP